jgi:hypothetical protein
MFLMSCELYILLTQSDFVDEQVCIHWALSYFKGRHVASFAKHILWQELRSGKMCFASWHNFMEEFVAQRMRQPQRSCDSNPTGTTKANRM